MCSGPSFNCTVLGSKDGSCGMTVKQFLDAAGVHAAANCLNASEFIHGSCATLSPNQLELLQLRICSIKVSSNSQELCESRAICNTRCQSCCSLACAIRAVGVCTEDREFTMDCLPYEFSTGSCGWEGHKKETVTVHATNLEPPPGNCRN